MAGSDEDSASNEVLRFRGFARVRLSALKFDNISSCGHRQVSERNVSRLVNIFRTEGCQRGDEQHAVKAIIDERALEAAHTNGRSPLHARPPKDWNTVPELEIASLDCLNGFHRILAAKRFLSGRDQWWIARVLTNGTAPSPCHLCCH